MRSTFYPGVCTKPGTYILTKQVSLYIDMYVRMYESFLQGYMWFDYVQWALFDENFT